MGLGSVQKKILKFMYRDYKRTGSINTFYTVEIQNAIKLKYYPFKSLLSLSEKGFINKKCYKLHPARAWVDCEWTLKKSKINYIKNLK